MAYIAQEDIIHGCTDLNANNFNPYATTNDGSCIYPDEGVIVTSPDNRPITLENVLDKLADTLIMSPATNASLLAKNQKTVRNGILSIGRVNSEKLILFEKDTKANKEDLGDKFGDVEYTLESILAQFVGTMQHVDVQLNVTSGDNPSISKILLNNSTMSWNITPLITESTLDSNGVEVIQNPLNISQFINIKKLSQNVDINKADEYLDTTIFELLPTATTRQQRIDEFFQEVQNLTGNTPNFDVTDGLVGDDFDSEDYSEDNDISAAQDTPNIGGQEEDSFITRLNEDANSTNDGKTLQSLRDSLNDYLIDVDQKFPEPQDERPEYINESSGYLKFRNLNQGIIIRSKANKYIEGLNPETRDYLQTGFTITAWVKFLDNSSTGTIFNFGNPLQTTVDSGRYITSGFGFALDTFVLKYDTPMLFGAPYSNYEPNPNGTLHGSVDNPANWAYGQYTFGTTFGGGNAAYAGTNPPIGSDNVDSQKAYRDGTLLFDNIDTERFIRLVVKENDQPNYDHNGLRGSHGAGYINIGGGYNFPVSRRDALPQFSMYDDDYNNAPQRDFDSQLHLPSFTRVPYDPTEWYFICATYNPNILEDDSHDFGDGFTKNQDFWNGNVDVFSNYTSNSGYGSKCKVEIISRTDLLRARGFKI